ncbi:hypothetical protein SDC9_203977 [bioreactor metagenome]|uniref:Uncharacterized protein n=1 Tax=bioreactor metagenome TaxID=1076179 RepID=A0A645IY79_9ZZZZ
MSVRPPSLTSSAWLLKLPCLPTAHPSTKSWSAWGAISSLSAPSSPSLNRPARNSTSWSRRSTGKSTPSAPRPMTCSLPIASSASRANSRRSVSRSRTWNRRERRIHGDISAHRLRQPGRRPACDRNRQPRLRAGPPPRGGRPRPGHPDRCDRGQEDPRRADHGQ